MTTKIFLHETTFTPPSIQIKVPILHLVFTVDELCYISQKYQPPSIFLHKKMYPSIISEKIGALHRNRFSKHTLFTTFSPFLKVSEFVIIQLNADFLINQPIKYFCTRHLTIVLYFKKTLRSPSQMLLESSTFYYYIFTSFDSGWGVLYFI